MRKAMVALALVVLALVAHPVAAEDPATLHVLYFPLVAMPGPVRVHVTLVSGHGRTHVFGEVTNVSPVAQHVAWVELAFVSSSGGTCRAIAPVDRVLTPQARAGFEYETHGENIAVTATARTVPADLVP